MKIRTRYDPPPIPIRNMDWSAMDDDTYNGPGSPIGFGPTEQDAIDDLLCQIEERELDPDIEPDEELIDERIDPQTGLVDD
jgi:hypothetical protein